MPAVGVTHGCSVLCGRMNGIIWEQRASRYIFTHGVHVNVRDFLFTLINRDVGHVVLGVLCV